MDKPKVFISEDVNPINGHIVMTAYEDCDDGLGNVMTKRTYIGSTLEESRQAFLEYLGDDYKIVEESYKH